MKRYQLLILTSLMLFNFTSEARLKGPNEADDPGIKIDLQEQKNAEAAAAAAREKARVEAFNLNTKNARIDIEKKAIAHLMIASKKMEAKALAEVNDGELMTSTENILLSRITNKVGQLNLNLSVYGDVELNKLNATYQQADAKISDFLYALYMKTIQNEQDKILKRY